MYPFVPSYSYMFMLEAMTYKVRLQASSLVGIDPHDVIVEAWTNQFDQLNSEGNWHAIPLKLLDSSSEAFTFGASVVITGHGDFEFTYRAKLPSDDDYTWFGRYSENGFVHVEPPRAHDEWTLGPNYDHILNSVFCGNFIAATNARECGFTHVLNVADNLDIVYTSEAHGKEETPIGKPRDEPK